MTPPPMFYMNKRHHSCRISNNINLKSTSCFQIPDKIYTGRSMYQNMEVKFIKAGSVSKIPASPFSPFSPSFPSGPSFPGGPMGPMAPGGPGGPGFPSGPAGPGRLQTSCEVWLVMFRPLLGKTYRDWQQATDSKHHIKHICSMTGTVEPPKKKPKNQRIWVSEWSHKVLIQTR